MLTAASHPSGHLEVVKLLVASGAEVDCKDKKAYTPLHAAASSGMSSTVHYLLGLGVQVGEARNSSVFSVREFGGLRAAPIKLPSKIGDRANDSLVTQAAKRHLVYCKL